jgi:hypothetical protein
MSAYPLVSDHRSMIFDEVRNRCYAAALKQLVNPQSIVLDLGSGLGLHGLLAAALGAKQVYLVDPSPVTQIARKIVNSNGLSDRVSCIQKPIGQAHLPQKVDIIVSVFTGNFLLQEDLLPALFLARDRFLKPSGVMLPDSAEMHIVPVSAAELFEENIACWTQSSQGINFSCAASLAANQVYASRGELSAADFLTEPQKVMSLDFNTAGKAACSEELDFLISRTGLCHGFLGWFKMRLAQQWLSTSPDEPRTHWSQIYLPLELPLELRAGDSLNLKLLRPQFGDWTWVTSHGGRTFRNSTFLSGGLSLDSVKLSRQDQKLKLSPEGRLAHFVTTQLEQNGTPGKVKKDASRIFQGLCTSNEELDRKIQRLINRYADGI